MIACLDDFYRKRRLNQSRWGKVTTDIEKFKKACFNSILLPKTAVDPYCLYREDMQSSKTIEPSEKVSLSQPIMYRKYSAFRKSFNNLLNGLDNFINQFASVLLGRVENRGISTLSNVRLSRYNLFDSSKELVCFQKEYEKLFYRYSTFCQSFQTEELENRITLLNMWTHICDYAPKGYAIAYDLKLRYRKSSKIINDLINTIEGALKLKSIKYNNIVYLLCEFNPSNNIMLEDDYKEVVLNLRKHFEIALPFMSERWYLETHDPALTYLPLFNGVPLSSGFMIPLYRLLDVVEDNLSESLFPIELTEKAESIIFKRNQFLQEWKVACSNLASLRIMMIQYNSVISNIKREFSCEIGIVAYIKYFWNKFNTVIVNFINSFTIILEPLNSNTNDLAQEIIMEFPTLLSYLEAIDKIIFNTEYIEENIIKLANDIGAAMIILQSDFIDIDK